MLETLMKLWKKALDILWIPQETLWDVEVIKSAVNTMLANKDFAEHITVMDINNNTHKLFWLILTGIDEQFLWFNNGAVMVNASESENIIVNIFKFKRFSSLPPAYAIWDILVPAEGLGFDRNYYRVVETASNIIDKSSKFVKNMIVEDINWAFYRVDNITEAWNKSDFNWANVKMEKVKAKVRPIVENMINQDRDNIIKRYDDTIQQVIKISRQMEALNNETSLDEYITRIVDGVSWATETIKQNPMVKSVTESDFVFTIHTNVIMYSDEPLGEYEIIVNLNEWYIKMKNLWGISWHQHPHVNNDRNWCWGTALTTTYKECLKQWNPIMALDCALALLYSYNAGNPYISMDSFKTRVRDSSWYKNRMKAQTPSVPTKTAVTEDVFNGMKVYSFSV